MSQPLLSVNGLMMRFGGLLAVNNVNLELYPQEIVSLIGPNGAGKTTVFNCLTGFYKPTGGTILLRDQHLEGLPGQQIARMGVVRTFQHVRLFREMTVIENLLVAQHQQLKTGLFSGLLTYACRARSVGGHFMQTCSCRRRHSSPEGRIPCRLLCTGHSYAEGVPADTIFF